MEGKTVISTEYLINFNFYQLIEILSKKYNFDSNDLSKKLMEDTLFFFSSNEEINFPTSDINNVIFNNKDQFLDKIEIVVNFLGLQGANGPLPGKILSEIAHDAHNQDTIRKDYLNFFNHHLIVLLYEIWRKYKYYIQFESNLSDGFSRRILNLIGVNKTQLDVVDINWNKLLFYIGIIHSNIRTAEVLSCIIKNYFELKKVTIDEFQRQLITIDEIQLNKLGMKNVTLGNDFIVGKVVTSYSNKFKINIYSLDVNEFYQFLPSGKKFSELKEIMKFLLKDQLPFDLCLSFSSNTQSNFRLGNDKTNLLGWSTLLNSNSDKTIQIKQVTITGQA